MNAIVQKIQAQLKRPGLWNIGRLLSATVLSQIVSILLAPVVTRLYDISEYGFLAIMMSFSTIFGTISTLQYSLTVLLPKEDQDAKVAMALSLWLGTLISVLVLILVILFLPFLPEWFGFEPLYSNWLLLLPLMVFSSAIGNTFSVWANRQQHYGLISTARVASALSSSAISVGLGFLVSGPVGLVLGLFTSNLVLSAIMVYGTLKKEELNLPFKDIRLLKAWAIKNKNFPLISLPSEFMGSFINQLPVFFLGIFNGSAGVGLYSICNRVLAMPVQLVSNATGEVFRQKAALSYSNTGSAKDIFIKTLLGLTSLSILPFTILAIWGPDLFAFIFGQAWREAGVYARVLSIMYFFRFVSSPLAYIFFIAGKMKADLILQVYLFVSTASIFFIFRQNPPVFILTIYALNYAFVYLMYAILAYNFSKKASV